MITVRFAPGSAMSSPKADNVAVPARASRPALVPGVPKRPVDGTGVDDVGSQSAVTEFVGGGENDDGGWSGWSVDGEYLLGLP